MLRVPGVDLALERVGPLAEAFGDEVAAVRGGVDEDVLGALGQGALEQRLERPVGRTSGPERQRVGKNQVAVRSPAQPFGNLRQRPQILRRDLDEPQPGVGVAAPEAPQGGRFAGAARAVEERVLCPVS